MPALVALLLLTRLVVKTAGQISWTVVGVYIKAMGGWPTFLLLAAWFLMCELFAVIC